MTFFTQDLILIFLKETIFFFKSYTMKECFHLRLIIQKKSQRTIVISLDFYSMKVGLDIFWKIIYTVLSSKSKLKVSF